MDNSVRKEWLTRRTTARAATRRYPLLKGERAREFWAQMRAGTELWHYKTPLSMWQLRAGGKGVAIVRGGEVVTHFATLRN